MTSRPSAPLKKVTVPIEPTVEMLIAGRKQLMADMIVNMGPSAENCYRAMILAAQRKPK